MIAAPGLCGLVDTVLRSLRDEVGLWWYTYRRAWKQNAAASLLPGALFGLVLAAQIFAVSHIGLLEYPGIQLVTLCLTTVLLLGIGSYLFPLLVLVELPFFAMLKDSLLLFLKNLSRSLGVALILFVFIAAMMLWFPVSAIVLAVGGLWVPVYLACRKIYPILDKEFDLTAAFAQKRQSDTERSQAK